MAALEGLPTFAVEWKCDWKGPDIMTDPKENLDKFDPSEWEKGQKIDLCSALIRMLNGETVYNTNLSAFYQRHGKKWRVWLSALHGWSECYFGASTSGAHDNGGWRTAVRKPKPEPVKPAEPTADEILNALKCGKRVVDADGDEVALFWLEKSNKQWLRGPDCIPLPLTIKPEPKPRRRVTREEAIIAMVKDPEQRAWTENDREYQWCGTSVRELRGESWFTPSALPEFLYLDPPEGEG